MLNTPFLFQSMMIDPLCKNYKGKKHKSTNLVVDKGLVLQRHGPSFGDNSFRSSCSSVVTFFGLPSSPSPHCYKELGEECTCVFSPRQAEIDELQESHLESLTWKSRVGELQRLLPDSHPKQPKGKMVAGQLPSTAEQKGLHREWLFLCSR